MLSNGGLIKQALQLVSTHISAMPACGSPVCPQARRKLVCINAILTQAHPAFVQLGAASTVWQQGMIVGVVPV